MQLNIRDVARLLSIPEAQVYRWLSEGRLPSYRVHDDVRFNRTELLEWAALNKLPLSSEVLGRARDGAGLAAALEAGGIRYGVTASGPAELVAAMLDASGLAGDERRTLEEVLLSRAGGALTPVGDGIAFPHARRPAVAAVPAAAVALLFLERPLDLKAPDGKPVDTMFFLLSPTPRAHLHMLSRLAAALHDPALREALARRAPAPEILAALRRLEER